MTSEYQQSSPGSNMLGMGAMGPGFGGGSQSGSEYDFGTPQSMSIDTLMQGSDMNGAANMANYRSAPSSMPGNLQGYGSAYDANLMNQSSVLGGHMAHRASMNSLQDGQSPVLGHHHQRLSISSNSALNPLERQMSGNTDPASSNGQRGHGQIGENGFANNSNDSINSQNLGDDGGRAALEAAGGPLPLWSELKTKAGKERKRLPLACIACRRKKIRCSGEKPACKHCLRSRIPCVYKVTTRKAAPRTDYMAMLDKRLKRMEERVIKIIPKEEQSIISSTGRANVKPPLPPPPPKSANSSKKRAAESAFGDELDDWATKHPAVVAKADVDEEGSKEPLKVKGSEEHSLLQEGADKLPSREIQGHLAEVFFDYLYCQSYPLLHKPSFMRKLEQGSVPPVLTLAVCAIAARFSNHPEVRTEPAFLRGESWGKTARDIALRRYDTPNITILIVYLILGLHEFGTCQGGRSWMFGGMAQRMAYALQLHKDLDHDPKTRRGSDDKSELTFTDREIRRRTMWSCFLMDRFNSSGTDRPIFVGEQYIRAQLPIKDSYFQMEITGPTEDLDGDVPNPVEPGSGQMANAKENMGITAYLIRLVAIWGKWINYLNLGGKDRDEHPMWDHQSNFQRLKREAQKWKMSLPDAMQYTPDNLQNYASEKIANQFIFLHIVYYQVILFTNRFALPTAGSRPTYAKDTPSEFIQEASRAAHDAANQISALVHEGMDYNVVAPFAGYAAFFSSTVHIYGAFSKKAALETSSKQNLAWNVKYLTKMKKYWGMFHFVTENLRDLYRRHADAARFGSKGKEGDQAIFQYGDWFDRYPHGVSGTDYEEPSDEIKKEPGADGVLGQKSDLQSVEEFFAKLSPPSRAAHNQAQHQQQSQRKMAKRRQSKSDSKQSKGVNTLQQQDMSQGQQQPQPIHRSSVDLVAPQPFQNIPGYSQHSTAFPPGFQQPPNPLLLSPQQHVLSQLDRQMVLNSYAGVNQSTSTVQPLLQQTPMLDPTSHPSIDSFDFNAFAHSNNGNQNYWNDPTSTTWFMPFNMEPPALSEDGNVFDANYDWSNFAGFGDITAGMPPTGLTPGRDLDLDTGQDGLGSLDGLDNQ